MKKQLPLILFLFHSFLLCEAANCLKPFGLHTTNTGSNSTILHWDASVTADSFMIRYNPYNTLNYSWKIITGAGGVSSYTLTGLIPGVKYAWVIRSYCALSPNLGYQNTPDTFTTAGSIYDCAKPFGIGVSGITNTTALVNWSNLITADIFRIRYSVIGSSTLFYKDVNAIGGGVSSSTLTNLTLATTYLVQVSSICAGISSGYSPVFIFTTGSSPTPCAKPFNLGVSSVTNYTATVYWTPYVTADTFRIRYSVNGLTNYMYKDISGLSGTDSATLTNLIQNVTYRFQVSSICNGVSSGYSSSFVFATANIPTPCITPYNVYSSSITGTSAILNWTPNVTADSFMIRYSVYGTTNYFWDKISGTGGVTNTQLTGLSLNTSYQWQVRSICAGVTTSIYSISDVFTTSPFRLRNTDDDDALIRIFPNPVNDRLHLDFISGINDKGRILLFDFTGRLVISREINIHEGENEIELNTSSLSHGIYSLIFETHFSRNVSSVVKE